MDENLKDKCSQLEKRLLEIGKDGLCIAFSGGVDSTLLLDTAASLPINVTAVTFSSRLSPKTELVEAAALASSMGVQHYFLTFDELTNESILANPPDRCYHCKKFIFSSLKDFCKQNSLGAVADGTNADDLKQYRPGLRALRELEIYSPLAECGFTKAEVRAAASSAGLEVHSKPSAPCLATRVPYGTRLTDELLCKIETGEEALKSLGFLGCRLRAHGNIARVEVPISEFEKLINMREKIIPLLKKVGFVYITLDLEGFRSGSMDIVLEDFGGKSGR
jgi:uncharacterized protein